MEIKLDGFEQLIHNLDAQGQSVVKAESDALMAGAEVIRAEASRLAPRFTGFLETHILAQKVRGRAEVQVGPSSEAFWGLFVEFGYGPHGHRTPEPFMRPALDTKGKEALETAGREFMKTIEGAIR